MSWIGWAGRQTGGVTAAPRDVKRSGIRNNVSVIFIMSDQGLQGT